MSKHLKNETVKKIEKAIKDNTQDENTSLFHYTSIQALYNIIKGNNLRLTNSMYMNDRSEFAHYFKMILQSLNEIKIEKQEIIVKKLKQTFQMRYDDHINYRSELSNSSHYIFSTCSSVRVIPMWNYYSKSSGICIEFDKDKLYNYFREAVESCNSEVEKKNKVISLSCIYNENKKRNLLKKCIELSLPEIEDKTINFGDEFQNTMLNYSYMFKEEIFEFENEKRMVITFVNDYNMNVKDRSAYIYNDFYCINQTIRPCIFIKSERKLPIKKIYISPFNNSETIVNGLKFFLRQKGYNDVEVEFQNMSVRNNY